MTLLASILLNNVNETIDPCDDFYEFACGKFRTTSEFPNNHESVDPYYNVSSKIFEKLEMSLQEETMKDDPKTFKKLKQYYNRCLNQGMHACPVYNLITYIFTKHFISLLLLEFFFLIRYRKRAHVFRDFEKSWWLAFIRRRLLEYNKF